MRCASYHAEGVTVPPSCDAPQQLPTVKWTSPSDLSQKLLLRSVVLRVFAEMQVGEDGQTHSVSAARLTLRVMEAAKDVFDALFERVKCGYRLRNPGCGRKTIKFHEWLHDECGLRCVVLPADHPRREEVAIAISPDEMRLYPEHLLPAAALTDPAAASNAVIDADVAVLVPAVDQVRSAVAAYIAAYGRDQQGRRDPGSPSAGMFFGRHLRRFDQDFRRQGLLTSTQRRRGADLVSSKMLNAFAVDAAKAFLASHRAHDPV